MVAELLFWGGLGLALIIGFIYFRDLGDVSQMFLNVKRENTIRLIRIEVKFVAVGLLGAAAAAFAHLALGAGPDWAFISGGLLVLLFYGFTFVWVHAGLRDQKQSAKYVSIEEARKFINPSSQVIVIENDGAARAHTDYQLMRPHLAGTEDGLGGKNIVMTYCAMANLGQGFVPTIEGKNLKLNVLAQHGNNLILRDEVTSEPIQQIYGSFEEPSCPVSQRPAMQPWPTIRMSFTGFQKAYPDGEVFVNIPTRRPLLWLLDQVTDAAFTIAIGQQHRNAEPVMGYMESNDSRLPKKTYIWGINIGEDAVCYTQDFIIDEDMLINTRIGGRDIVLAWHPKYQSFGAWYNDSGEAVGEIDFFGKSDRGELQRVEMLKSGMFFHVWAEFFPHTDINRVS